MKAVIFDCDGTLVDSEELHYLAWRAVLQEKGYFLEKHFYIEYFCGVGDLQVAELVGELFGFSSSDELISRKNKYYEEYQKAGIAPIKETVAFATRLFEQKEKYGVKLAVASGARKEEILFNLKGLGIDHYFEAMLSGKDDLSEVQDPEGTNKPKPYVYLKTARLLGVKPQDCIAIEDSRVGISSAVSAGCFTVAVPNHFTREHDLSLADLQIASFAGVSVDAFFAMIFDASN